MGDFKIQARLNGSYLVPGPLLMKDESGELKRVDKETISLCRCGGSKDKPFCDGTHRSNGFTAPAVTLESD
jgi:CDGSH-type Zn-finger protein